MDANFNIAILDGHKEFVAHEKFQQLLHKKWGQRDRMQLTGNSHDSGQVRINKVVYTNSTTLYNQDENHRKHIPCIIVC